MEDSSSSSSQVTFMFQVGLVRDLITTDASQLTLKTLKDLACNFINQRVSFPLIISINTETKKKKKINRSWNWIDASTLRCSIPTSLILQRDKAPVNYLFIYLFWACYQLWLADWITSWKNQPGTKADSMFPVTLLYIFSNKDIKSD